ncbi:hypothetical protein ACFOYU_02505 [Microvirga sp. GCM10011540]|uniref:hypothetical protein n=1 Tax=Microvirga sp. GCM10011540 TaxID=3317338 RepID=UPI0036097217
MDQPYSVWADLLNKFHTSSDVIQALWLVVVPVTLLGVTWLTMRTLRDIALAMRPPRPEAKSLLVYGVVQDADGQWHVIRHGDEPRPLDWRNAPRELVGGVAEFD